MERQLFIKKEAVGTFGKTPEERTTEELLSYAVVNIDKPKGPTSHQIADFVRRILHTTRAGHSGTLDPAVTGVQPVAIGRATRIAQFLLTAPKEYVGIMHLHADVPEEKLREAAQQFLGKIQQLPPVRSAVKRQLREREIYEFELLERNGREVLFRVQCQAGTYIRKFCHDLGKALGSGAHMAELRRTQAGPFTEQDHLVTLSDLQDALVFYRQEQNDTFLRHCLQPIEAAVKHLPKCWLFDTTLKSVSHGRDVGVPGISKLEDFQKGALVALLTLKNELVAIGEANLSAAEIQAQEKGLAIIVKKVFLEAL